MGTFKEKEQAAKREREDEEWNWLHVMTNDPEMIQDLKKVLEEKGVKVEIRRNFLYYKNANFNVGKFAAEFWSSPS